MRQYELLKSNNSASPILVLSVAAEINIGTGPPQIHFPELIQTISLTLNALCSTVYLAACHHHKQPEIVWETLNRLEMVEDEGSWKGGDSLVWNGSPAVY